MTRMLIIGPRGSGNGTQAERISEPLGLAAISAGDIFRANVKGETGWESKPRSTWTLETSFRTA